MLDILVVDDHPLMRAGLTCLLDTTADLHVVGTAADGVDAVARARELRPDVVLLDLSMPRMDGFEATRQLRELEPAPTVVVLTSTCAAVTVRQAFDAGAAGYLLKDMPPERLLAALRGLSQGHQAIDPRAERILATGQRRAARSQGPERSTAVGPARRPPS